MNIVIYDREKILFDKLHKKIINVRACGLVRRYIHLQCVTEHISCFEGNPLWAISPNFIKYVSCSLWSWSKDDSWYASTKSRSWYLDMPIKAKVRKYILARYK